MIVRLVSIPHQDGLDVNFELSPQLLRGTGPAEDRPDQSFQKPAVCTAHLEQSGHDVFVNAELKVDIQALCYRCGQEHAHPLVLNDIFVTCTPRRGGMMGRRHKAVHGELHEDAEEGLAFFQNNEIDLGQILREHVWLNLPLRYLCREDCPGYQKDLEA